MARVLVVDDDDQVRGLLVKTLERAGHDVLEASNGMAGTRRYNEAPCDVVITDVLMPEMEGLQTIRELRRSFPDVKIIAISGGGKSGNLDFLQIAKSFGAVRTIPKPFTANDIIGAVREVLSS